MAFTIKERAYFIDHDNPPPKDCVAPKHTYKPAENILGPFTSVTQSHEEGFLVVHGHHADLPGHSFGPWGGLLEDSPRPIVWVMNDHGATVATYHL